MRRQPRQPGLSTDSYYPLGSCFARVHLHHGPPWWSCSDSNRGPRQCTSALSHVDTRPAPYMTLTAALQFDDCARSHSRPHRGAMSIAGQWNAVSQADLRGIVKFFVTCFDWPWPPPCSASPCQCGDNLNSLQPFGNSDSNGEHLGGQRHLNTVVALVNRTFSKFVGGGAGRAGRGIQAFCKERDSLWKQPRLKSLFVSFSFGSMRESTTL